MYLLLYALWLVFNGRMTLEVCILGIFIVGAVGLLMYALFSYTPKTEWHFLKKVPIFMAYLAVLLVEILKAGFAVLRIITHPKEKIEQSLVVFSSGLETGFARFVLANSITLTPGTITVHLKGDRFTVHCLDKSMADGIETGTLMRLLKRMEAE